MKIQIECSEKELQLLDHVLEVYARLSMCQLKELSQISSFQKLINDSNQRDYFDSKLDELKWLVFDLSPGSFHGIHSNKLDNDARIAFDLHQTIRYELWKTREEKNTGMINHHPADTCKIYGMDLPNFKITIE